MNRVKGLLVYSVKSTEQRIKYSLLFMIMLKRTRWAVLVTLCCLSSSIHLALGQNSFEIIHSSPGDEFLYYSFEDANKNYVAIGAFSEAFGTYISSPRILKLNSKGEIVQEKLFPKEDSTCYFKYGFQKANGNYFLIGALSDSTPSYKYNFTFLCELTPDLELVWEKMHAIPEKFSNHFTMNYLLTPDSILILQGRMDSSMYGSNDLLFLSKFDMNGNLIKFTQPTGWKDYGIYSDLIFKTDSIGYYLVGDIVFGPGYPRDWVEFDLDLNLLAYGYIEDSLSYLYTPLSIVRLIGGNMMIANCSSGILIPSSKDLEMRIVDQGFNLLKDTILFYDEHVYLSVNKGLGFIDPENIWVTTFEPVFTFLQGTDFFRFHIFDSQIHLKGVREYGGDTRYWLNDMIVTSDGGCLVTGVVPDFGGSYDCDGYIIKVMPSDILTSTELPPINDSYHVALTPNPFSDCLRVENKQEDILLSVFNVQGIRVYEHKIPHDAEQVISTGSMPSGLYIYSISNQDKVVIQSGKMFKQ
jgi:hypothetical protein